MQEAKFTSLDFYYFSGTGNTLRVVRQMKEVFEKNGVAVTLYRIEKTDTRGVNVGHAIGLAFPVACQGTYPFVWEFVKSLPKAPNTPLFMVDTLAGFSGGVVGPMRSMVEKNGYRPVGAKEIIMPSNFFSRPLTAEKKESIIRRGLEGAEVYANAIMTGKARWGRVPLLSDFISMVSQGQRIWKFFRKIYPLKADAAKCTKCKLCLALCPVNNISIDGQPAFGNGCVLCMRCVSFCPSGALYRGKGKHYTYKAVEAKELL